MQQGVPSALPFPLNYDVVYVARGDTGESIDPIPGDIPVDVVLEFTIDRDLPPGRIEVRVSNDTGEILFTTTSADNLAETVHPWTFATCMLNDAELKSHARMLSMVILSIGRRIWKIVFQPPREALRS